MVMGEATLFGQSGIMLWSWIHEKLKLPLGLMWVAFVVLLVLPRSLFIDFSSAREHLHTCTYFPLPHSILNDFIYFSMITIHCLVHNPTIQLVCFFTIFRYHICLFVTLRSLAPCVPWLHAPYRRKALDKERCMVFVSWRSDLQWESFEVLKFLWMQKLENYSYFCSDCGNGRGHTSLLLFSKWTEL